MHFRNRADLDSFVLLIGQKVCDKTKSVWFPEAEIGRFAHKRFASSEPVSPQYPVYIISKGRWESRLTVKALDKIGVPYRIVVEPQELDAYASVIDSAKILTLPFSNLGQGSIPARNWVWEHSLTNGDARHWILDGSMPSNQERNDIGFLMTT